jgi:hypothetical protein
MNYFLSFAVCAGLIALGATEANASQLLSCDINVAIYLALAWSIGRRKKA